jgi:hypothetical protein
VIPVPIAAYLSAIPHFSSAMPAEVPASLVVELAPGEQNPRCLVRTGVAGRGAATHRLRSGHWGHTGVIWRNDCAGFHTISPEGGFWA